MQLVVRRTEPADPPRPTDSSSGSAADSGRCAIRFRDQLTGLRNREQIAELVGCWRGSRSVVLIDVDRFKAINDTYGHHVGDAVLRVVADRLRAVVGAGDLLVRTGGDEFAIFVPDARVSVAKALGERARHAISCPIPIGGVVVFADCTVGIACGGGDEPVSRLMSRADACTYQVKRSGSARRVVVFDPDVHDDVLDTLALSVELRAALERQELVLHYQPIVDMVSRRTLGFEALVRWAHPERGLLPPMTFIPLAEQLGLMPELGGWVLEEACRRAALWQEQSAAVAYVSVNLSVRQLEDPDLFERFRLALGRARLSADRLVVEVTESVLATRLDVVAAPLEELRRMGARVYLDDFGTGYSSLGYIRDLPLDGVKLDGVFTRDLTTSDDAWAIVCGVVTLLRKLGLPLTAEGIESAAHLAQLRSLGCNQGQGYYFGRPLPASRIGRASPARRFKARNDERQRVTSS